MMSIRRWRARAYMWVLCHLFQYDQWVESFASIQRAADIRREIADIDADMAAAKERRGERCVYYDGPAVTLSSGTWVIDGTQRITLP